MKKKLALGAGIPLALLLVIQLIPVKRENPPVGTPIVTPQHIDAILRRACFDCHSHETRWPWYAWVAPMSWLVARDVNHGREHLNFSMWNVYSAKKKREKLEEVWEEVAEGNMPLPIYVVMHPEAALSDDDKTALYTWLRSIGVRPPKANGKDGHKH